MYISTQHNTIFEFQTGDSFRTSALRNLLTKEMLVVSRKMMINEYYKKHNAVSIHSLKKFIKENNYDEIKVIVIDTILPSAASQAHKALMKLCKGKQIVFIHAIVDQRSLVSAVELMSVTKNCKVKSVLFSQYLFTRGRW